MSSMDKKTIGQEGEERAAQFLSNEGYSILVRNYQWRYHEIDLIAKKDGILCFVEVKTRKNSLFGYPEEFVDSNQKRSVRLAAENYMEKTGWRGMIRFDIISVLLSEITHFEDAF